MDNNKKRFQNWLKKWEKSEQKKFEKTIENYFLSKEKSFYKTNTKQTLPDINELDSITINMVKKLIEGAQDVENIKVKKTSNLKENKNIESCNLFNGNWNEMIKDENYFNLKATDQEYPIKDSEYGNICKKINTIRNLEFYQKWFLKNLLNKLKNNDNLIFNGMIVIHESENFARELILPILECLFYNEKDKIIVLTSYSGLIAIKEQMNLILNKDDLKQYQKRIEWYSYEDFYSKKYKITSFEDSILILGDAHRLRKELLERGKKKSEYLQTIFQTIKKCKFILAYTETPFFKSFWDFISLYEIIYKPKDTSLPKTFTEWLQLKYKFNVQNLVERMEDIDTYDREGWIYDWISIKELKDTVSLYLNSSDNGMFPKINKKIHYINSKNGDEIYSIWYQDWNEKILKQINNSSKLSFESIIEPIHICNSLVIQKINQENNNYKHKHSLKIEALKKILDPIIQSNNKIEDEINQNKKNGDFDSDTIRLLNIERVLIYVQCDDGISCIINLLPDDKYIIMNQTHDTLKIDFQFLDYFKNNTKPYLILKKPPQEPSLFPPIRHILFMTQSLTVGDEEKIILMAKRKYAFQFMKNQDLMIHYFYLMNFDKNNEIIKNSTVDYESKLLLSKRHKLKQESLKFLNLHSIQKQDLLFLN